MHACNSFQVLFAAAIAAALPCSAAVRLLAPAEGETVPLLSDGQKARLSAPRAERVAKFADPAERAAMKKLGYVPLPAKLRWEWAPDGVSGPAAAARPRFAVEVRRLPDGKPVFRADCQAPRADVTNLEIAREYEWTVWADVLGRVEAPVSGRFRTEDAAPRLVAGGDVPNVRDIGGRIGLGGRRVRQGLVYRSAGLNSNASPVYSTREEVLAASDNPERLLAEERALKDGIAVFRAYQADPAAFRLVSADISGPWTVFRPLDEVFAADGDAAIAALDRVPGEFLGAQAETAVPDDSGVFAFPLSEARAAKGPAVFMREFDASGDGWLSLGCGADWWWKVCVNGETAFDRYTGKGNNRPAKSANDHVFAVPVKKGRNVLAAVVRPGSEGWLFACRTAPAVPVSQLLASGIRNLERRIDEMFKIQTGMAPGKSRIGRGNRSTFLDQLGIRSDVDLRSDTECYGMEGSPLGPAVRWFHYSSGAYAGMAGDFGRKAFANVFRVFLDPANYPVDFHCIAGQDRTGAVAFILNALLGVDEEELWRDWEATGFWNGDPNFNHDRLFKKLVAAFDGQPGPTIHDRVLSYVLSLGFTEADVETFREIMLEPVQADGARE